jgi:hypothetical protein
MSCSVRSCWKPCESIGGGAETQTQRVVISGRALAHTANHPITPRVVWNACKKAA